MDGDEELTSSFVIAVDELGQKGLWTAINEFFETRLPLKNVSLSNKLGRVTNLSTLAVQYVPANDKRLLRLKPLANSSAVWWRNPYAHMILMCTADINEYRAHLKTAARKVITDLERDGPSQGGVTEWFIVYIRPPNIDPGDKATKKVYDKIVDDFGGPSTGPKRPGTLPSTRVVRLDWPYRGTSLVGQPLPFLQPSQTSGAAAFFSDLARPFSTPALAQQQSTQVATSQPNVPLAQTGQTSSAPSLAAGGSNQNLAGIDSQGIGAASTTMVANSMEVVGMEDVEAALKECVRCSFESRQAAYVDAVQRLLAERFEPGWLFSHLFLVKDCYTQQLETAGMWGDALQEGIELEATFTEALARNAVANLEFGGNSEGDDAASLISQTRRSIRRSVLKRGVIYEFSFRQFLFATQARLLLRLGRPIDMAQSGLAFVKVMGERITAAQSRGNQGVPQYFKEAWTFSACICLALTLTAAVKAVTSPSTEPDAYGRAAGRDADNALQNTLSQGGQNAPQTLQAIKQQAVQLLLGQGNKSGSEAASQQHQWDDVSWDWNIGLHLVDVVLPLLGLQQAAGSPANPADWHALLMSHKLQPEQQQQQLALRDYHQILGYLLLTARSQLITLAKAACMKGDHSSGNDLNQSNRGASGVVAVPSSSADTQQASDRYDAGFISDLTELEYYSQLLPEYGDWKEGRFESTPVEGQATQLQALAAALSTYPFATSNGSASATQDASLISNAILEGLQALEPHHPSGQELQPYPSQGTSVPYLRRLLAALTSPQRGRRASSAPAGIPLRTQGSQGGHIQRMGGQWLEVPLNNNSEESLYETATSGAISSSSQGKDLFLAPRSSSSGIMQPVSSHSSHSRSNSMSMSDIAYARGVAAAATAAGGQTTTGPVNPNPPLAQTAAQQQALSLARMSAPIHKSTTGSSSEHGFRQKLDVLANRVTAVFERPGSPAPAEPAPTRSATLPRVQEQLQPSNTQNDFHTTPSGFAQAAMQAGFAQQDATAENGTAFPWISDWRLRVALSSPAACEALLLQIGLLSVGCLAAGGRGRSASLLLADTALLFLKWQRWAAALALLEARCSTVAREGWHLLHGVLLSQVLHVQQLVNDPALPYTCMTFLSLPKGSVSEDERLQVQQLLSAMTLPEADNPYKTTLSKAHSISSTLSVRSKVPIPNIKLPGMQVLKVTPTSHSASLLVGQPEDLLPLITPPDQTANDAGNSIQPPEFSPVLYPPPLPSSHSNASSNDSSNNQLLDRADMETSHNDVTPRHQQNQQLSFQTQGAALVWVGQTACIQVTVESNMPAPLPILGATAILGVLQPTTSATDTASLRPMSPVRRGASIMSTGQGPGVKHAQDRQQARNEPPTRKPTTAFKPQRSKTGLFLSRSNSAAGVKEGILDEVNEGAMMVQQSSGINGTQQGVKPQATHQHRNSYGGTGTIRRNASVNSLAVTWAAETQSVRAMLSNDGLIRSNSQALRPDGQTGVEGLPYDDDDELDAGPEESHWYTRGWSLGPNLATNALLHTHKVESPTAAAHTSPLKDTSEQLSTAFAIATDLSTVPEQLPTDPSRPNTAGSKASLVIHPGTNILTFNVAPSVYGLYYLKQLSLCMQGFDIACNVCASHMPSHMMRSCPAPAGLYPQQCQPEIITCDVSTNEGGMYDVVAEDSPSPPPILMVALPPQKQLQISCVAPGGSIITGSPYQWFGIIIQPLLSSAPPLQHVRMTISTPEQQLLRIREHPAVMVRNSGVNVIRGGSGEVTTLQLPSAGGGLGSLTLSKQSSVSHEEPLLLPASKGGFGGRSLTAAFPHAGSLIVRGGLESSALFGEGFGAAGGTHGGDTGPSPTCRALLMLLNPCKSGTVGMDTFNFAALTFGRGFGMQYNAFTPSQGGSYLPSRTSIAHDAGGVSFSGFGGHTALLAARPSYPVGVSRRASVAGKPVGTAVTTAAAVKADVYGLPIANQRQDAQAPNHTAVVCGVVRGTVSAARALKGQPLQVPMLLWLPVHCPQKQPQSPQAVHIVPLGLSPAPSDKGPGPLKSDDQQVGSGQVMDLSLEYQGSDGTWRVQETRIPLAVKPAFTVEAQAYVIPRHDTDVILMAMHVRNMDAQPVILHEIDLMLQAGFVVNECLWEGTMKMPKTLLPHSSLTLAWYIGEANNQVAQKQVGPQQDGFLLDKYDSGLLGGGSPSATQRGLFGSITEMVTGEEAEGLGYSPTAAQSATAGQPFLPETCLLSLVYTLQATAPRAIPTLPMPTVALEGTLHADPTEILPQEGQQHAHLAGLVLPDAPRTSVMDASGINMSGGGHAHDASNNEGKQRGDETLHTRASVSSPVNTTNMQAGPEGAENGLVPLEALPHSLFKWNFSLIHHASGMSLDTSADSVVSIQLLMPTGESKLGRPMSFVWRISRVSARAPTTQTRPSSSAVRQLNPLSSLNTTSRRLTSRPSVNSGVSGDAFPSMQGGVADGYAAAGSEQLTYRVVVGGRSTAAGIDGGFWRLLSKGEGQIRLGLQPGAAATVEVLVVPLMLGYTMPPRLVLQGCKEGPSGQEKVLLTVA